MAECKGFKVKSNEIVAYNVPGAVFATAEQRKLEDWLREAYRTWKRDGRLPWTVDREVLRGYR